MNVRCATRFQVMPGRRRAVPPGSARSSGFRVAATAISGSRVPAGATTFQARRYLRRTVATRFQAFRGKPGLVGGPSAIRTWMLWRLSSPTGSASIPRSWNSLSTLLLASSRTRSLSRYQPEASSVLSCYTALRKGAMKAISRLACDQSARDLPAFHWGPAGMQGQPFLVEIDVGVSVDREGEAEGIREPPPEIA